MDKDLKPKTILCIPGTWKDRSEIVTSIARSNKNEFLFAGQILLNLKTNHGLSLEIEDHDERIRESFKWAGLVNEVQEEFLDAIDRHTHVAYIIDETGSLDEARAIAEAGLAVLKAGGIGIKVESTGKAFTAEHWTRLLTDFEQANLYELFVLDSITDGEGTVYTCGMHNLGLRDAIVSNVEFQDSVDLLSVFGYYQLVDKPTIRSHQTFSISQTAPVFEITDEPNQPNRGDELFENPYGMWRLTRR